uniref:Uncharacterized protein n=1 Tax=Eutreptiella gymnastica TaxID=73025 RepID=A0A6U7WBS3_9EUGL
MQQVKQAPTSCDVKSSRQGSHEHCMRSVFRFMCPVELQNTHTFDGVVNFRVGAATIQLTGSQRGNSEAANGVGHREAVANKALLAPAASGPQPTLRLILGHFRGRPSHWLSIKLLGLFQGDSMTMKGSSGTAVGQQVTALWPRVGCWGGGIGSMKAHSGCVG